METQPELGLIITTGFGTGTGIGLFEELDLEPASECYLRVESKAKLRL